jgi:hypothetical protein
MMEPAAWAAEQFGSVDLGDVAAAAPAEGGFSRRAISAKALGVL